MSRWSRRSEEDKQRILRQQMELRRPKVPAGTINNEDAGRIYEAGEVPIICSRCMCWSSSEKYEISFEHMPITNRKEILIKGTCKKCGQSIKRVAPFFAFDEGIIFLATATKLKRQGRLTDSRPTETPS